MKYEDLISTDQCRGDPWQPTFRRKMAPHDDDNCVAMLSELLAFSCIYDFYVMLLVLCSSSV